MSAETVLDVGFAPARKGLAAVADGGQLMSVSGDAYSEWGKGLAGVGPLNPVRSISRLAEVRFAELTAHQRWAGSALRWETAGPGGVLFPVLDADLTLAPYGESASLLALTGVYRPPLGAVGAALDRVVLRRVTQATIQGFVNQVGEALLKLSTPAQAV